jgi:hypothetical protein
MEARKAVVHIATSAAKISTADPTVVELNKIFGYIIRRSQKITFKVTVVSI